MKPPLNPQPGEPLTQVLTQTVQVLTAQQRQIRRLTWGVGLIATANLLTGLRALL